MVAACLLALLSPQFCAAQDRAVASASEAQAPDPQFGQRRNRQSPDDAKVEREMAKARNKEREQQLKDDTDRLLKLATELKQYVDKTNENILSLEVLKKTDEIEKLAKSVRDKMKAGGYEGVVQ
jgi:flagellar motility protein MotE (MotC chaperone)